MTNNDNQQKLLETRQIIDDIDNQILNLIAKRENCVKQISKAKNLNNKTNPVRFSREARIFRKLHNQYKKNNMQIPFKSIALIWNEIITAFTLMQNEYYLFIDGGHIIRMNETENSRIDYEALARQEFGNSANIVIKSINLSESRDDGLYILPHMNHGFAPAWWSELSQPLNIIASLPFVHDKGKSHAPEAYVVGTCDLSFSSDDGKHDIVCLKLEFPNPISLNDNDITSFLETHDICPITTHENKLYCERHAHVNGSASLDKLQELFDSIVGSHDNLTKITIIGLYAKPLEL